MSKEVEKQKLVANAVLDMLRTVDPSAIVAGGAPRDWWFNKPATDIDVFFYFRHDLHLGYITRVLYECGFDILYSKDDSNLPEWYKKNPNLRAVFGTRVDGVEVQLILLRNPTFGVVGTFPMSICQIWYKNGEIRTTNSFIKSVEEKVLIKTNHVYSNGDKYIQKIREKFPTYKYYDSLDSYVKSNWNAH